MNHLSNFQIGCKTTISTISVNAVQVSSIVHITHTISHAQDTSATKMLLFYSSKNPSELMTCVPDYDKI